MKKLLLFVVSSLLALASPAFATIYVVVPASQNVTTTSPFILSASADTCKGQTVSALGYSFDDSTNTTIIKSSGYTGLVQTSTGQHTLHVKCWGTSGSWDVHDIHTNVTAVTQTSLPAVSLDWDTQSTHNWTGSNDEGTSGWSNGWTGLINSPSLSGAAREFTYTYGNYGGYRFWSIWNDDVNATHFVYDAHVFIKDASSVALIEMDMNQVLSNGDTVIYGFQCDGWTNTWDYTKNANTRTDISDQWVHSNAYCPSPSSWAAWTWHDVQIAYHRDQSGNVTYESVSLDGTQYVINATVYSDFALGWDQVFVTNFQLDGKYNYGGSGDVVVDKLAIFRW